MPQDRLHELICNLNQSEKRYFKQYLSRVSSSNNNSIYARLFDYMSQNKKYDREQLLVKCDFIKSNQFQSIRTRLYDYILESLRAYKSDSSNNIKLHEYLINYEILTNKGLFVQAWKLLLKAEKLAYHIENFNLLEDILIKQEYIATARLKDKKIDAVVKEIEDKRHKILSMKKVAIELKNLHIEAYTIFKEDGRIRRMKNNMDIPLKKLQDLQATVAMYPNAFSINFRFHRTIAIAYGHCGHFDMAEMHMRQLKSIFENNRSYIQLHIHEYITTLNRLIIDLNTTKRYNEALQVIAEMRIMANIHPKNKELQLMIFENANFQELEIYIKKQNYTTAVRIMENFIPDVNTLENKIHTVNQQSKFYRICLAYFGNKDYRKALQWSNKILNTTQSTYRKDILSSVELLNLLIHYKLENYNLLSYRIPSTINYLKKIDRYLDFEKVVLSALNTITNHGVTEKNSFLDLIHNLDKIEEANPLAKYAMAYFDLKTWLKQEITTH